MLERSWNRGLATGCKTIAKLHISAAPLLEGRLVPGQWQKSADGKSRTSRVFVLDTCYLLSLASSGYGVYQTLSELSAKGDVIITRQVLEEFRRNMVDKSKFQEMLWGERTKSYAELMHAVHESVVLLDNACVSAEDGAALSARMRCRSGKKNSRVGAGEASIALLVEGALLALYEKVIILSKDSDVPNLLLQVENLRITTKA